MWLAALICVIIFAVFYISSLPSNEEVNAILDSRAKEAGFPGFHPTIELSYGFAIDEQNKLFSYMGDDGKLRVSSLVDLHVDVLGYHYKNKDFPFIVRDEVSRCERGGFELKGEIYLDFVYCDNLGKAHRCDVKFTGLNGAKTALDYQKRINNLKYQRKWYYRISIKAPYYMPW